MYHTFFINVNVKVQLGNRREDCVISFDYWCWLLASPLVPPVYVSFFHPNHREYKISIHVYKIYTLELSSEIVCFKIL